MNVLFRCRVDKPLLKKAEKVTRSLGTSTGEMFRIFLAQIARTGRVAVNLGLEKDADILPAKATHDKLMRSLDDTESFAIRLGARKSPHPANNPSTSKGR